MPKQPKPERLEDVEITPEAEARFLTAVRAIAQSGPKHRPPKSVVKER